VNLYWVFLPLQAPETLVMLHTRNLGISWLHRNFKWL